MLENLKMVKIIKSMCLSPEAEEFVKKHIPNLSAFVEEAVKAEMLKFNAGDSQEALEMLLNEIYPQYFARRLKSASMAKNYVTGAYVEGRIKFHNVAITPLELYERLNTIYAERVKEIKPVIPHLKQ